MHCDFAGVTHEPGAKLAAELIGVAPGEMSRVFYSDNGSTAVGVALELAFQYWQQNRRPERRLFLTLPGAYRGDTVGASSVRSVDEVSGVFRPPPFGVQSPPEPKDHDWSPVFETLFRWLRERRDEIAGVIVEPIVQGSAAMRVYAPEFLAALRDETNRADTFLILDEGFTGFGRTGPMWASNHAGISPDLLCTSKGLSGGVLPFAATLVTKRIYDGFRGDAQRAPMPSHPFCGNPLGASVAREVLAIYRDEEILAKAQRKAERLRQAIHSMSNIPGVRHPRAQGMCGAFEVGESGHTGGTGAHIGDAALALGAHLRPLGDTICLVPPLNIADEDFELLLDILREATTQVLVKR